jgi:hypothetical protein
VPVSGATDGAVDAVPPDAASLGPLDVPSLDAGAVLADGLGVEPPEQAPRMTATPARALAIRNFVFMAGDLLLRTGRGRSDRPAAALSSGDRFRSIASATHGRVPDSSG